MDAIHKERILQLADHLDSIPDHQFSLEHWLAGTPRIPDDPDDCDTVACIAGYTVLLFADRRTPDNPIDITDDIAGTAQRLLGLNDDQAFHLFTPTHGSDPRADLQCDPRDVTNQDAAGTLRYLADTERVHWFCEAELYC